MIKTVEPQIIGAAELVTRKEVFIEAHSPNFNNVTAITPETFVPTVRFKLNLYTLESVRNGDGEMEEMRVDAYFVDEHFFREYEIKFVAGRDFSDHYYTDSR